MPDSFFATNKPRKRKRSTTGQDVSSKKIARKGPSTARGPKPNGVQKKKDRADEELESDATNEDDGVAGIEDMDLRAESDAEARSSGDEDEDETPAEKRLRLAKLYLESVKEGLADGEYDAAEIDKELIGARLKQDVMEHSGKVHLFVADSFDFTESQTTILRTRGHRLSVTSAVASEDARWLFTAGKEGSIIKWDLSTGKKSNTFRKIRPEGKGKGKERERKEVEGHIDEVLALAMSSDGKYLASGGKDRRVGVWDVESDKWIKGFGGHKDLISALAFRKGSQQLYSASFDRTLKLFDLSVMGYVETLFGHQDSVLALDALKGETAVSVGARDKTVRFWKIVEESQLVFRGGGGSKVRELLDGGALEGMDDHEEDGDGMEVDAQTTRVRKRKGKGKEKEKKFVEGSIECVAMIDESTFISGGDSGSICLWTTQKKKPIFTQALAHGLHDVHSETEGLIQTPRWITALASLRYSDLFASGSWDGTMRLWKLDAKLKSFALVATVPVPGVINSLQLLSPPTGTHLVSVPTDDSGKGKRERPVLLVAGTGHEHRLGRWWVIKEGGAVNGAVVIALKARPRTLAPGSS